MYTLLNPVKRIVGYLPLANTLVRRGGSKALLVGHVDCGISWVVLRDFADRFMIRLLLHSGQDCLMGTSTFCDKQGKSLSLQKLIKDTVICKCNSWMQFLIVVLFLFFFSGTCPIITWQSCPRVALPSWWIWSRCVWDTIPSVTSRRERSEALVPCVCCKCSCLVRKPLGSRLILHVKNSWLH